MTQARAAIFLSGRGSNAQALLEAAEATDYPVRFVGVLSDQADAKGLAIAERYGVPTAAIERSGDEARADHEARIEAQLVDWRPDLICLAGYMRILSATFTRRWEGRLLNIHPSLLPSFPGLDTHARALQRGVRVHGCTVHLVTEGVDEGPILDQSAVRVEPDDTADTLAARVLRVEHALYHRVLAQHARSLGFTGMPSA